MNEELNKKLKKLVIEIQSGKYDVDFSLLELCGTIHEYLETH